MYNDDYDNLLLTGHKCRASVHGVKAINDWKIRRHNENLPIYVICQNKHDKIIIIRLNKQMKQRNNNNKNILKINNKKYPTPPPPP
jgi:hypothetical protein